MQQLEHARNAIGLIGAEELDAGTMRPKGGEKSPIAVAQSRGVDDVERGAVDLRQLRGTAAAENEVALFVQAGPPGVSIHL